MNIFRLVTSVFAILIAGSFAKFGNENYEMLKADGGLLLPIAVLLIAIFLGIYGLRSFFKAFS